MTRHVPVLPIALALLASAGCRPAEEADPLRAQPERPAPAAAVAPGADSVGLAGQLATLEAELRAALETSGDDLRARTTRAEAITDRLLEEEPSVRWLAQDYLTEARLRQFQVMADRVVARLRRGASSEDVEADLEAFAAAVVRLRQDLERGGVAALPPPLDSLLRDTAAFGRSPAQAMAGAERAAGAPAASGAAQGGAPPAPAQPAEPQSRLLGTPVDSVPR